MNHVFNEIREDPSTVILATIGATKGIYEIFVKDHLTAERTWALLGLTVITHELICSEGELLSEGADRAIEKHPLLVPLATLAIAAHVANLVPEKMDLIHYGFKMLKGH